MREVSFDEVEDIFHDIWCNSEERLFHEIAWDCLGKAGLTTYSDDKTFALIYVYAYVIQMLCDEFSYMAYDEPCWYDYTAPEEEPLTDAAIGWLYRDAISGCDNAGQCFCMDANEVFCGLIKAYRHRVANVIFQQLGENLVGTLLYFAIQGKPLTEDDEKQSEPFKTKEELIEYCNGLDHCFLDSLKYYNAMKVQHWLSCNSCATDD